jgi:hypothetical protein
MAVLEQHLGVYGVFSEPPARPTLEIVGIFSSFCRYCNIIELFLTAFFRRSVAR